MSVTAIGYDWGVDPIIIRMTVDNTLAEITTAGYWPSPSIQADVKLLNNGELDVPEGSLWAINYSDGEGIFTLANAGGFVVETSPGALSETLASGHVFVGSALNVATGVAMSGDVAIANTGATTIQAGAVDLGMLSAGIAPSHVVKFAAQHTTTGGAAAEAITVTGALATDLAFVQLVDDGTANVSVLNAVVTADTLTVTFSADPGNDAIINYQLLRAAV